ncbi:MAG: TetR/AcrR family transcriptional regulator [Myxococcales bacterium]|nr:TetR/AcrR family transcriptional regulator [Myxococcales bacterium]
MGRPKEFEVDDAIRCAARVFGAGGYAGTSIQDLEREIGVGRKSLYDTFGDKRELFLRVLDRCIEAPYPISSRSAGLPEIERMFHGAGSLDPAHGTALLTNAVVEFGVESDEDVALRVKRHLDRLERLFALALERALGEQQIAPLDVPKTARYLTSSLQGLWVMARAGAPRAALRDIADVTLSVLRRQAG